MLNCSFYHNVETYSRVKCCIIPLCYFLLKIDIHFVIFQFCRTLTGVVKHSIYHYSIITYTSVGWLNLMISFTRSCALWCLLHFCETKINLMQVSVQTFRKYEKTRVKDILNNAIGKTLDIYYLKFFYLRYFSKVTKK